MFTGGKEECMGLDNHWWIDGIEFCRSFLVASVFSVKWNVRLSVENENG